MLLPMQMLLPMLLLQMLLEMPLPLPLPMPLYIPLQIQMEMEMPLPLLPEMLPYYITAPIYTPTPPPLLGRCLYTSDKSTSTSSSNCLTTRPQTLPPSRSTNPTNPRCRTYLETLIRQRSCPNAAAAVR